MITKESQNDYWASRIGEAEAKAQKTAAKYLKRERAYYQAALKSIDNEINALYAQIQSDGIESLTRSQLWQYKRWQQLRDQIYYQSKVIGSDQISLIDECLDRVCDMVLGDSKNTLISGISSQITKNFLNENWSGMHYSQRVWNNTGALAQSLEQKISDMLILGKTPDQVKKEVMNEFGASFHQANRLIRTETSYVFNQSALQRYALMGAKGVQILSEKDCCDICAQYDGKSYNLNDAPMLPAHANCRCCYTPII